MINKILQVVSLLFVAVSAQAATVSFNNSLTTVNQGDNFSLTIQGSDFATIAGGGLNLSFNASVLQINSVTINQTVFEFYLGGVEEGMLDNLFGQLLNTSFNSFFGASGNFDIMDIGFTAVGAGSSSLALSESLLWSFADEFGGYYGDQIAFSAASVNVVSAVPVPAAAWLFGSGLIGLAGIARRRSNNV